MLSELFYLMIGALLTTYAYVRDLPILLGGSVLHIASFSWSAYFDKAHPLHHNIKNRRSTFGYVVIFCNGTIAWSFKMQHYVTLSSTKADYVALTYTSRVSNN